MPVTLIVLVMFYKISKITDNATCLKGSPVPHFFITEFKNLRASFQIHVLFCCRPNSLRWRTTSVVLWSSSIRCVQIQEANLQCCTMSCQYLVFKYSRTSPQWLSWGQRKEAIVERWPLWEVIWHIFFREYKYSRPICNFYVNYQHCSIQMEARLVVVLIESSVSFICITTWFTLEKYWGYY